MPKTIGSLTLTSAVFPLAEVGSKTPLRESCIYPLIGCKLDIRRKDDRLLVRLARWELGASRMICESERIFGRN
ncbi:hypothetical protein BT69DRAFT_267211 [Atractiella rhizophila]|nr:hypothetical protein BT69DRAFT_267211 [Atractiella rhizophila]